MSIAEKVQSLAAELTQSERKLVEAILRRPKSAALGTALELFENTVAHVDRRQLAKTLMACRTRKALVTLETAR